MTASILFWLALPLPGYALLRRFSPHDTESGLLGTIALSYLYSLGLLSPASIFSYLVHLPVGLFSSYIVLVVTGSIIEIVRKRWLADLARLLIAAAGIEMLILLADLLIGARIGAFLTSDAKVHLARIRFLLDHGFSNDDPYLAGHWFFPIYHTNLIHALYAACSQITRSEPIFAWYESLPWGKLLISAGTYYMVWCVFRRKWPAWTAALFVIGVRGPYTYLIYPNQLAPFFLIPMMIGFLIKASERPTQWASAVKLAVGSLLLGQFHGLYVIFTLIALGPVLAAIAIWRIVNQQAGRWRLVVCAAALLVGFPFVVISKKTTPTANLPSRDPIAAASDGDYLRTVGAHWVMRNPESLISPGRGTFYSIGTIIGLAYACRCRERRRACLVAAILGTTLAWLYCPPLCTVLLRSLGQEWILQRFDFLIGVCGLVFLPGAIACALDTRYRLGLFRPMLSVLALAAGMLNTQHVKPEDWPTMLGTAWHLAGPRRENLRSILKARDFLREHVPPGETILTDSASGIDLAAVFDCRIIVSDRGVQVIPELKERGQDLVTMLAAQTPWPERRTLLRKYQISYFWPRGLTCDWVEGHFQNAWTQQGHLIIKLKTDS